MVSEAGGDPTQGSLARGDPELHVDAVNQELRDELAEMRQSYHLEVHASRMRSQELSTRYSTQAWRAIQYQNECFHEAAQHFEQASADVTEAAVAQEREQHNELINNNSSTDTNPCYSMLKPEYNNMNTWSNRLKEIMPKFSRNTIPMHYQSKELN